MVDFQERDTSRGLGSDDEETADEQTESSGETESEETPGAAIKADDDESHDHDEGHGHDDEDHHHAHDLETVRAAIVTVSSTRTREEDTAGDAIEAALTDAEHSVATRDVVRDDFDNVQSAVDALVRREDVDIVVTTGGTGVTPDDVTVDAVEPLCEKRLPGFGELFRRLSEPEIGTKIVGSRAMAGIADGVPVFCLPGSENAARLGTAEIIVEQAGHLAGLAGR